MKRTLLVWVTCFVLGGLAAAQDIAGTINGVFGGGLGMNMTVDIPDYGTHGVVDLLQRTTAQEVRDSALPIFVALANTRPGVVSVSVQFRDEATREKNVVLFQKLADGTVRVFLNGEPF